MGAKGKRRKKLKGEKKKGGRGKERVKKTIISPYSLFYDKINTITV